MVFAIVPQTLIKGPELASDLAYWFGLNFGIAAFCDWATRLVLPDSVPFTPSFRAPHLNLWMTMRRVTRATSTS